MIQVIDSSSSSDAEFARYLGQLIQSRILTSLFITYYKPIDSYSDCESM